jgi:hypothetical protein
MTFPGQPDTQQDPSWPPQHGDLSAPPPPGTALAYAGPPAGYPPGYLLPGYGPYPVMVPTYRPTNGLAIAALVCSLVGIVTCFPPISLVGAIFGHVARGQIRSRGESGDGLALSGIIIGWIVFGLGLLFAVLYFGLIAAIVATIPSTEPTSYPTGHPS